MKNKVMKLGLLAMMVMGGMNAAHAANNEVVVSGQVLATTCDVSVPAALSLRAKPADILAANTIYNAKPVKVTLTNCVGDGEAGMQGRIRLTAPTSALGAGYFNTESSPTVAIGVAAGTAVTPLLFDQNVQTIGAVADDATALSGQELTYNVGLAAPSATPAPGVANANLKFEFFYN